jgi:GntR family transcriptional regulator
MADIHRKNPVPLYHQLREILRNEILEGRLKPGDRVATEFQLMSRYQLSRTTVRQTISELQKEGLLIVNRGKGTFVRDGKIEPELSALTGFVEDMLALGLEPSARVLSIEEIPPDKFVAGRLGLAQDDRVIKIVRVRLANQEPVSYDVSFLPYEIGARVAQEDLVLYPIFTLLEDKYGVPLGEAEYRIEASLADAKIAEALGMKKGSPMIYIERTTFSESGTPVDFEQLYYRGDKMRYTMRLKRKKFGQVVG